MIEVVFTCKRCNLNSKAMVPSRESPNVDVTVWIETVMMPRVGNSHMLHSPYCSSSLFDVRIPVGRENDGEHWIGKQT